MCGFSRRISQSGKSPHQPPPSFSSLSDGFILKIKISVVILLTANQKKRNLISLQDYQSIWTKYLNNALITKTPVWENGKCYDLGGR
jgi:hypothetical protein